MLVGVTTPAKVTIEWLDQTVTRSPALWQAFGVARAKGIAPHDLVVAGSYDESKTEPPVFAVMDHASAKKLLGPMLVPRWIPLEKGAVFQRDLFTRLDEAKRLGLTLVISILVTADGTETMYGEGVAHSQHKGQA